mmetsp:Transcript_6393/g.19334  ORF Transcript_6393/g.19334 Transcript_6393/m.19334 type:complete len:217 (+) Transcript_6393:2954-3604(+)
MHCAAADYETLGLLEGRDLERLPLLALSTGISSMLTPAASSVSMPISSFNSLGFLPKPSEIMFTMSLAMRCRLRHSSRIRVYKLSMASFSSCVTCFLCGPKEASFSSKAAISLLSSSLLARASSIDMVDLSLFTDSASSTNCSSSCSSSSVAVLTSSSSFFISSSLGMSMFSWRHKKILAFPNSFIVTFSFSTRDMSARSQPVFFRPEDCSASTTC